MTTPKDFGRRTRILVRLVDGSGKLLFDTIQPSGLEPLAATPEHTTLQAFQTGKPAVSELVRSQADPAEGTLAIALPIFEAAQIQCAICVRYRVAALSKVFDGVYVPARWIMALFDREGTLIASTRNAAQWVGQRGPWEPTKGGIKTLAVVSWVPRPSWSVGVGMPEDQSGKRPQWPQAAEPLASH